MHFSIKKGRKSCGILRPSAVLPIKTALDDFYNTPWAIMASATFIKPAMLAPFT